MFGPKCCLYVEKITYKTKRNDTIVGNKKPNLYLTICDKRTTLYIENLQSVYQTNICGILFKPVNFGKTSTQNLQEFTLAWAK